MVKFVSCLVKFFCICCVDNRNSGSLLNLSYSKYIVTFEVSDT